MVLLFWLTYVNFLSLFLRKTAQNSGLAMNQIVSREMSGAGFSFALDKLVYALGGGSNGYQPIEVVICVCGSRPPLKDVTQILRALWAIGIRTSIIEAINEEETLDLAKDSGASHIILLGEGGVLRVRTWTLDRFQEKYVTRPELISYIQTKLRPPDTSVPESYHNYVMALQTSTSQNAIANLKNLPAVGSGTPALQLIFMTAEKLTANKRKRCENQINQNLTASLNKFVKKEKLVIIVCDLNKEVVKAIVGMDPRDNDSFSELQAVIERYEQVDLTRNFSNVVALCRFPKQKKYISEIYDEIIETLSEAKTPPIVGLYSIPDNYYRLIL
jgi:eukaryotic translation initiation factor 2-alpha kinase 4